MRRKKTMYNSRLTKQDLIDYGIDEITEEGYVYRNGKLVPLSRNNRGYLTFTAHKGSDYKTITLSRAIWAWFKGEVPEGMVVDHVDNSHRHIQDYRLENLQCITQKANVNKDKPREAKPLKCDMHKPRGFYEAKLDKYEGLYKTARQEGDQEACHKWRTYVSQARARLKYWDAHADEYGSHHWREEQKKELKSQIADLFKEIEEQKENNIVCKENGWNYFWHLGVWIINNKRGKIRELKKELRELE